MSTTPRAAPTQADATQASVTKQPISWVDMEDDDDFGFLPVHTGGIKAADAPATPPPAAAKTPTKDDVEGGEGSQDKTLAASAAAATNKTVTKKKKPQQPGGATDPATQVKSKTPLANIEKNEAAKSFVQRELLARNLFPSFVEVTVDGAVPYSLKSTAAINLDGVDAGALSPATKMNSSLGGEGSGSEGGNSPVQPDTSRRAVFDPAEPVKATTPSRLQSHQLPAAIAATVNINVADRSHLGRRRRAIRVVADTLVSNGGKAMNVNDVVKLTKWNKTFRPGLGCLFSFIKSLPAFFVYHHGMISLTYEEDIASSMLRTWSETDPQAAELTNIAATNAAAIAVTQDTTTSSAPTTTKA